MLSALNHLSCFARAVLHLAMWLALAATVFAWSGNDLDGARTALLAAIGARAAAILFLYPALYAVGRIRAREQAAIDAEALRAVADGRPYFLYLRSFTYEDAIRLADDNEETRRRVCGAREIKSIVPSYLAVALRDIGPTLGIGGADYSSGFTKITTDDAQWWSKFQELARGATAIFVIPAMTLSSERELRWLFENALPKTVFVLPPLSSVDEKYRAEFAESYEGFAFSMLAEQAEYLNPVSGMLFQMKQADEHFIAPCELLRSTADFQSSQFKAIATVLSNERVSNGAVA